MKKTDFLRPEAVNLFLGRDPARGKWQEWQIQAYIIQNARREGYFIEGDQNSAKRSYGATARAKACGMQNGTTDIRLILPEGRTKWIEIKKHYNKLSPDQEKWHSRAKEFGHDVGTIFADTPAEGWEIFKAILMEQSGI